MDANTAEWFEWAQLPGVGEILGRRIVETRRQLAESMNATPPVFNKPTDLRKVRGIGPKILQRISTYLRFSSHAGPR
ncbi:MAG: ComEA family DNA-binding protein [Burkholderiales bacterium]